MRFAISAGLADKRPNHLLPSSSAWGCTSSFGANRQEAAQKALIGTPWAQAWHHWDKNDAS